MTALADPETIVITPRNSVVYDSEVEVGYTDLKIQEIEYKVSKLKPEEQFYLVLDTPGGLINPGLKMIFRIKALRPNTKTITIYSASMGFEIVQNLGERLIVSDGKMLSHRKKWVDIDFEWPIEKEGQLHKFIKLVDAMDTISALRMGMTLPKYQNLIMHDYKATGDKAVQDHAADRVVKVVCGKTMRLCPPAFMK